MAEFAGPLHADSPSVAASVKRTAVVREIAHPNPNGVRLRLEVPDRAEHLPGQHYVVRLTAEDGYVAQRSYSIASAPSDGLIELWVERLPDGEVSGFLAEVVEQGDELEVRGPIGGYFVWDASAPAIGLAGGSGVVPFVSMLRHARDVGRADLLRLAVSARTWATLPYAEELAAAGALLAITREAAPTGRPGGRLSAAELGPLADGDARAYLCGSATFTAAGALLLEQAGVAADRIRVETFGPSGDAAQ